MLWNRTDPGNTSGAHDGRGLSERAYTCWFFLLVLAILLFTDKGKIEGDGSKRWKAMTALAEQGQLTNDKYSIVQPLFAMPLYGLGAIYSQATGADQEQRAKIIRACVQRFNKFVALGLAYWFYFFLRRRALWSARHASLAVMFLLFGSMLIPHAQDFFSECLWTLLSLLSLTLLCAFRGRSLQEIGTGRALIYIVITALLVQLNPLLAAVLFFLGGLLAVRYVMRAMRHVRTGIIRAMARPDLLLLLISLVCGVLLCLLENQLRRGNVLSFGYPGEEFSTPFLHGLAGQLVAPARGIIFFMPAFFLAFALLASRRRDMEDPVRLFVRLSLIYSVLLVAAYAKWYAWHGAWYWGPRFLLPLSVFGCLYFALAVRRHWPQAFWMRAGLVAIGLLSGMVYKVGVSTGLDRLLVCLKQHPLSEYCYWQWEFLPYASWFSREDLVSMFFDRSTPVEAAAVLLFLLLWRFAPQAVSTAHAPSSKRVLQ